jgi:hypothetical protein
MYEITTYLVLVTACAVPPWRFRKIVSYRIPFWVFSPKRAVTEISETQRKHGERGEKKKKEKRKKKHI